MLFLIGWLIGSIAEVAIGMLYAPLPPLLLSFALGTAFHIAKVSRDTIKDSNQ